MTVSGQFTRLAETQRRAIHLSIDGHDVSALEGDTVLTALLTVGRRLRDNEFEGRPRSGFCLMGACQDCWIWQPDGARVRACSTPAADGMVLVTRSPLEQWLNRAS